MDPGPKDMSTVKKMTRQPRVTKAKAQILLAVDDGVAQLGDTEPGMTVTTRCTATGHVTPLCIYIVPTGEL